MKKSLLTCSLSISLGLLISAPQVLAADLLSLYREAIEADPAVAAAKASAAAARERVTLAQSANGLTAGMTAGSALNYAGANQRSPNFNSDRAYLNATVGAQASYPLRRTGIEVNIEQADAGVKLAEIGIEAARQDVILRLAQAYFDILLAQDTLALVGAQKAAVSEQLAQAKRNFEVGTATIVDTNEAQARFDQVLAQEVAAQNDLETKRWALRAVVGRYEANLKGLRPSVNPELPNPNNMDAWVSLADTRGFAVRLAQQQVALSQWEIERNKRTNDWSLDLVSNAGMSLATGSAGSNSNQTGRNAAIGVQFAMPLFTNGATDARIREAMANVEKLRNDIETARRIAAQSTRSAFLGVVSGISGVQAQQQALKSAEVVLASTRLGLEVGVRTNLDVLNAQQSIFLVRRDLASARYNAIVNTLRLKGATGTLDEPDVSSANAYLQ
jgi:outer membrane protein